MKILAIILARKNSKRLKKKHHLELDGKSLIDHTFDLLKKTNFFFNIFQNFLIICTYNYIKK